MGTDEDTWRLYLGRLCDDVGTFENGAIVTSQVCFLQFCLIAILLELLGYPLSTQLMSLAVHRARTEVTLGRTESIGRIGIKLDRDRRWVACLLLGCAACECAECADGIK